MLRQIGTSLLEADESFVLTADRDDVVVVWRGEVLQRADESSISLILHADIGQVLDEADLDSCRLCSCIGACIRLLLRACPIGPASPSKS